MISFYKVLNTSVPSVTIKVDDAAPVFYLFCFLSNWKWYRHYEESQRSHVACKPLKINKSSHLGYLGASLMWNRNRCYVLTIITVYFASLHESVCVLRWISEGWWGARACVCMIPYGSDRYLDRWQHVKTLEKKTTYLTNFLMGLNLWGNLPFSPKCGERNHYISHFGGFN